MKKIMPIIVPVLVIVVVGVIALIVHDSNHKDITVHTAFPTQALEWGIPSNDAKYSGYDSDLLPEHQQYLKDKILKLEKNGTKKHFDKLWNAWFEAIYSNSKVYLSSSIEPALELKEYEDLIRYILKKKDCKYIVMQMCDDYLGRGKGFDEEAVKAVFIELIYNLDNGLDVYQKAYYNIYLISQESLKTDKYIWMTARGLIIDCIKILLDEEMK